MGSKKRMKRGGASRAVEVVEGEKGECIGTGATAEMFSWGTEHVLKLFRTPFEHTVDTEAERSHAVHACGVASPAVFQIEEVEGRRGIVFARVEGRSLMSCIGERGVDRIARALAEIHAAIHQVPSAGLPTLREQVESEPGLDAEARATHLARIDQMPAGEVVCHGDLHPGNIVLSPNGPVVSDWVNAMSAPAAADVARTLILIGHQGISEQTPADIRKARKELVATYLEVYLELTDVTREEVARCEPAMAAALLQVAPDHFEREALEAIIAS